jgi:hypothetical protein
MESGMKTIRSFVFVTVAAACAGCATHEPGSSGTTAHTLPAFPQPQTYSAAQLAALRKTPGGDYPGYQRIVVDGQARYCRRNLATGLGLNAESKVICITEAQVWAEQQRAQLLASAQQEQLRRSGTEQLESQEAWRQQAQSNAVNNPMTAMPMTPMGHQ